MLELQDVWLIEISPGKGRKTASVRKEKCIALYQMSNCHRKPKIFSRCSICTCSVTERNPTVYVTALFPSSETGLGEGGRGPD